MPASAQPIKRLNIFSYNVNDGMLQSTIHDICTDENNFLWISFPNGVQKFDGRSFQNIPIQEGLPDDKFISFFHCANGELLLSHELGITRYNHNTNKLFLLTRYKRPMRTPATFLAEWMGWIYIYDISGKIQQINLSTGEVNNNLSVQLPTYKEMGNYGAPIVSQKNPEGTISFFISDTIFNFNLKTQSITRHPLSLDKYPFYLNVISKERIIYSRISTRNMEIYNLLSGRTEKIDIPVKDDALRSDFLFADNNKLYLTYNERLFELNENFQIKFEIVDFKNDPAGGRNSSISRIITDKLGNIYLTTVNDGIRKIMASNFPIKFYHNNSKERSHVLFILPEKDQNQIILGVAGKGLMVFDTLQRLIREINFIPGSVKKATVNTILKIGTNKYLLFVFGETRAFVATNNFSHIETVPIEGDPSIIATGYFSNVLFQNEEMALVQSEKVYYKINFSPLKITCYKISNDYMMSGMYTHDQILIHANDSLLFISANNREVIKRVYFPNTGYVRCYLSANEREIYIGSNKGIFKVDTSGKVLLHLGKKDGLPDECIYAMSTDGAGNLWCSSNKGIFRINKKNEIFSLNKEDGLQENEFNTNVTATAFDGELFWGGVNGGSSFFPSEINPSTDLPKIFITNIVINNFPLTTDTAVWNLSKINLKYNQSALAFEFIGIGSSNPAQYVHQYMLEGVDKEWVINEGMRTIRYNLQPGKYKLKLYASRYFNKDAQPLKELIIIIGPPLWKTWWFISLVTLFLISALVIIINRYNKTKYREKLNALEQEQKLQKERERISRDLHDNIGAFANVVLYKADSLQDNPIKNDNKPIIEDLKFAARDILLSLRETIWAFKNETFSTDECMLRIRNFIQPLSRYYPQIKFQLTEDKQATHIIAHQNALNLVRIVQEVITNAIKHASPSLVSISSIESEQSWKIVITDNGKGFNYQEVKRGNGLDNIEKRAGQSSISLQFKSEQHVGTSVEIIVPFHNP